MGNEHDVRKGIQQAKVGDTGLIIVVCQTIAAPSMLGHFTESMAFGLLAFVVLSFLVLVVSQDEKASRFFSFLVGGVTALIILTLFALDEESSLLIGFIVAPLSGSIIIGGNLAGLQHLRDISEKPSKNDNG